MIEITPDQRRELAEIFDRFAPECGVVAFGTRVTGGARPWSDLDLALVGPAPLGMSRMGALCEQLEESSLPFRVDVVDWHSLNESFRKIISRDGELLKGEAAVARTSPCGHPLSGSMRDPGNLPRQR